MKTILRTLLLILLVTPAVSQTIQREYLDAYEMPCEMEKAIAYRTVEKVSEGSGMLIAKEYYLNDSLKSVGVYTDVELVERTGRFTTYYPNGKIKSIENYNRLARKGESKTWFANGQLHTEGNVEKGEFILTNSWDSVGNPMVVKGNGLYEYTLESVDHEQTLLIKGTVVNGLNSGTFIGYRTDGTVFFTEEYKKGILVQGVSNADGKEYSYKELTDSQGHINYLNYLMRNLYYPAEARRKGIQGMVYFKLLFDENQSVTTVVLIKGVHPSIDEEARRVLVAPEFKYDPIIARGQRSKVKYMITPIKFKMG